MISLVVPSSITQVWQLTTVSRGAFEAAFRPLSPGLTGEHEKKNKCIFSHVRIKPEVFITFTSWSS